MATDNFNRANETPLASPWTNFSGGNLNLNTNQVVGADGSDKLWYYSGAASSADEYSELMFTNVGVSDSGPAVRVASLGTFDAYFLSAANGGYCKFVNGSFSTVASSGTSSVINELQRIEVQGSTLRVFFNGVPASTPTATDTSLTAAGQGAGVIHFVATDALDNWSGGNLVSTLATPINIFDPIPFMSTGRI